MNFQFQIPSNYLYEMDSPTSMLSIELLFPLSSLKTIIYKSLILIYIETYQHLHALFNIIDFIFYCLFVTRHTFLFFLLILYHTFTGNARGIFLARFYQPNNVFLLLKLLPRCWYSIFWLCFCINLLYLG